MNSLEPLRKTDFDISSAVLLANAAELAYEGDAQIISNWSAYQSFGSCEAFNRGNIQGYWAVAEDVALLVFRGTSNIGQWILNARFVPVSHPWGKVHKGFLAGIAEVHEELTQFEATAARVPHVWVAGHSLGGALAVLAASRLKQKGIDSTTYTFGQPRVGLGEFADRFDAELPDRLWRFINQCDIVARLPPGLIYRHCGNVKRIVRPGHLESLGATAPPAELTNTDPEQISEEEFEELQRQLNDQPTAASSTLEGRLSLFADHSMLEYIRLLEEIKDAGE